jgi:glycosyltransferase involved in cell wall biosynthesis
MMKKPRITIVCPLFNEEDNVVPLAEAVSRSMPAHESWELVLVDDGSTDATYAQARRLVHRDARIRVFRLARNYGQSTATQAGFDHARGDIIVTMDGDLQNDPGDIPALIAKLEQGYDLVAGYRENRRDRLVTRKIPSKVANVLIRWLTGVPIRDNGCSLKAYRRSLARRIGLYAEMHRFIPALAVGITGARTAELPVRHHPRRYGRSKYGLSRVWKVLSDLLVVIMIRWFRDRPLYMFALGALGAFVAALLFVIGAVLAPLMAGSNVDSIVLPSAAIVLIGLALFLLMVGLIAEVALRQVSTWRRPRSAGPASLP